MSAIFAYITTWKMNLKGSVGSSDRREGAQPRVDRRRGGAAV